MTGTPAFRLRTVDSRHQAKMLAAPGRTHSRMTSPRSSKSFNSPKSVSSPNRWAAGPASLTLSLTRRRSGHSSCATPPGLSPTRLSRQSGQRNLAGGNKACSNAASIPPAVNGWRRSSRHSTTSTGRSITSPRAWTRMSLRRQLGELRAEPVESLTRLSMPVLCISGEEDIVIPPETVRILAESVPNGRFVGVPNAGHSVYFERPAEFNAAVSAFLQEIDQPGAQT